MVGTARRLTMTQWTQLTQVARAAKEQLLAAKQKPKDNRKRSSTPASADSYSVSVAAEGSRLVGGSLFRPH
jgi:hypothetical protein